MFRVIIAGTRHFDDYDLLCQVADKLLKEKRAAGEQIVIISGHCAGADLLGERYARERGFAVELYEADWGLYGRSAGPRRNRAMAEAADALIAFWDGVSRGTLNMIQEARARGLAVRVKQYKTVEE